tara:strand:+ start:244 stop:777 length:534 start_codon:yes stop_codon:yes gene_type:complete
METRIKKKVDQHNIKFKKAIKEWIENNDCKLNTLENNIDKTNDLLNFIYEYENLDLNTDDFKKRKRIKNIVPACYRCNAKRANGEQCTRRKKDNQQFCGTHIKGVPHGIKDNKVNTQEEYVDLEIWTKDIGGILYYIDKHNNVYNPNDILMDNKEPEIIGKWEKNELEEYKLIKLNN